MRPPQVHLVWREHHSQEFPNFSAASSTTASSSSTIRTKAACDLGLFWAIVKFKILLVPPFSTPILVDRLPAGLTIRIKFYRIPGGPISDGLLKMGLRDDGTIHVSVAAAQAPRAPSASTVGCLGSVPKRGVEKGRET